MGKEIFFMQQYLDKRKSLYKTMIKYTHKSVC